MERTKKIAVVIVTLLLFLAGPVQAELRERVYLQTDKTLYLAGEMVWMKLLLTDESGRPETLSKIGYVELLDENTAQVQAKLDITNGRDFGWLELPLSLPTGYYRLVGYTRYMQNEGEQVFFEKILGIINTFRIDTSIDISDRANEMGNRAVPVMNTVAVTTDRPSYNTRSQGTVKVEGLPANLHTLSVSIAGSGMELPLPEQSIGAWRNSLSLQPRAPFQQKYIPEYEGHIIHGEVVNIVTGEAPATGEMTPLLGFVGDDIRLFGGNIHNGSEVTFYTRRIEGREEVVTTTLNHSDNKFRVDISSPFAIHREKKMPEFVLHPQWEERLLERSVGLQVLHTYMADSMSLFTAQEPFYRWKPERSYLLDEYTRFTTMEEVVIEFVMGLRFGRINGRRVLNVLTDDGTGFASGNSLVLLDGIPITDHEVIFRYDPLSVKQIDIYRGRYIFGGQLFNGIASFRTYNNNYPGLSLDNTSQFFDYQGTQARRFFYAPDYGMEENRQSRIPDYRHTLLWEPDIPLDNPGDITLAFNTSDLTGTYLITVEGLTVDGYTVYGTRTFTVD